MNKKELDKKKELDNQLGAMAINYIVKQNPTARIKIVNILKAKDKSKIVVVYRIKYPKMNWAGRTQILDYNVKDKKIITDEKGKG
jgi:hypothetical protein